VLLLLQILLLILQILLLIQVLSLVSVRVCIILFSVAIGDWYALWFSSGKR
jgi:hypothetical protein